jgi:hypothetical protein
MLTSPIILDDAEGTNVSWSHRKDLDWGRESYVPGNLEIGQLLISHQVTGKGDLETNRLLISRKQVFIDSVSGKKYPVVVNMTVAVPTGAVEVEVNDVANMMAPIVALVVGDVFDDGFASTTRLASLLGGES